MPAWPQLGAAKWQVLRLPFVCVLGRDVMTGDRIWVVSPSYADVVSFTILRERILEVVRGAPALHDAELHFVVIDDTAGIDHEISKLTAFDDTTVITPPFNLGHQRAIVYGLRLIAPDLQSEDMVVTMDSDGEDQPEDIPRLLAPLLAAPDEHNLLCLARRTKRQESFRFQMMYLFFRVLFRTLTGVTVRSGNYAAYRGWLAKRMLLHPSFDICYSSSLVSLDEALVPVPCARGSRYAGRSRMNTLRLFMHGIRMLVPFTDRIAARALAAFATIFGIGIALSIAVVTIRLTTTSAVPGWATATLLGIMILSFIALGNFLVLFVVFSHSRGISLAGLEEMVDRGTRDTSSTPD
jgi:polyisoprenyl-phosphate glycosyltransferase